MRRYRTVSPGGVYSSPARTPFLAAEEIHETFVSITGHNEEEGGGGGVDGFIQGWGSADQEMETDCRVVDTPPAPELLQRGAGGVSCVTPHDQVFSLVRDAPAFVPIASCVVRIETAT